MAQLWQRDIPGHPNAMRCRLHRFPLTRAVPLAISRGRTSAVEHLLVTIEHQGLIGIGETGGFDAGHRRFSTDAIAAEITALQPHLESLNPQPLQQLQPLLEGLSAPARCGLDLALWDWWGKRLEQPLWKLWGLDRAACRPISVTLGLGTVAEVLGRLERWWGQIPATRIKLKLGSPEGLEHDRALVSAVTEAVERRRQTIGSDGFELQVDANGGWDQDGARSILGWLAEQGVTLVEQPLPPQEDPEADCAGFACLDLDCPLPLIADESCWDLQDVLRLSPYVDGINIKLQKSGGLSEALLMARVAGRLGLGVMLGCYADAGLLNGAAAQLLPLVQWPDLDSHLNLIDDPFVAPPLEADRLLPSEGAGLGILPSSTGRLAEAILTATGRC